MTYTAAAAVGALAALVLDVVVLRTRLVLAGSFWIAYAIVFFFQILANGVLTGTGTVRYASWAVLGPRLVHAPVEDLVFGFALVLTTLALWVRLGAASRSS